MIHLKLFEDFNSNQFNTIEQLKNYLIEFSTPISHWGTGKSKTIEDLFDEIRNKECHIEKSENVVIRLIEFVGIKVYHKDEDGNLYVLKEDRQEFNDGRVRRRNMPTSVAEKMIFGESPTVAAIRGLKEELSISVSASQLIKHKELKYDGSSMSYPGLKTKYKGHQFTCFLEKSQFNPLGYIEIQKNKKTYFKWIKK